MQRTETAVNGFTLISSMNDDNRRQRPLDSGDTAKSSTSLVRALGILGLRRVLHPRLCRFFHLPDSEPRTRDDIYAALKWVYSNTASLGVDRERIAVAGESAGGGQAAGLALRARDRAEISLLAQVLLYPMLDDRTGSTRPVPSSMGQFIWTTQCNRFGWTSLLGVPAGSMDVPRGSVPARVNDLAGLPSTWIGVGSIDLFADEDVTYGRRLMDAGVLTELSVYPGVSCF